MADIEKLLNSSNIVYRVLPMPPGAMGFVYRSKKGKFHIFVSEDLSPKGKLEVLFHEIHHIIKDVPDKPYVIGLDMQREVFEGNANMFAREVTAKYHS